MRLLILLALAVAAVALTAAAQAQIPEYSHRLGEPAYIVVWDEEEITCEERKGSQSHVVECRLLERYRR